MNIEVEMRSFIDEHQYNDLLDFFHQNAKFVGEEYQETYYLKADTDLRIQKNSNFSKLWLKKGNIHDNSREEIEINFSKDDFEKLEKIFQILGHDAEVKWFRIRNEFIWKNVNVALDFTKGYGYIVELEIMTNEKGREKALKTLNEKFDILSIPITSREEFEKKFLHYKNNWKELTK